MLCKVCGKEGSFNKRSLVCRKCIYDRDFKSTRLPRRPVKKFSGIEPNKSIYSSGAPGSIKRKGHGVD